MISETQYEELIRTIYSSIKQDEKNRDSYVRYSETEYNFYDGKVIALNSVIDYIKLNFEQ